MGFRVNRGESEVNGWANDDFVHRLDTVCPSHPVPSHYPSVDFAFPLVSPPILRVTADHPLPGQTEGKQQSNQRLSAGISALVEALQTSTHARLRLHNMPKCCIQPLYGGEELLLTGDIAMLGLGELVEVDELVAHVLGNLLANLTLHSPAQGLY